jgi:cytochrome c oxidase subunit 2
MKSSFPLFPESASSLAGDVDALYLVWVAISVFFTLLIAGLILYLMARYRRRDPDDVGADEQAPVWLEIAWSAIPLAITLVMFAWGTLVFYDIYRPPQDAVEYTAIGRQWMWKLQHPEGQREINTLHVPVGQSVRLKLASEDVIHSFYIPAFRVKQDVVPGRYTSLWFRPTKVGVYHLFCAEYCGAEHSKMVGSVIVMEPQDYENWLSGGTGGKSMVSSGGELFQSLACVTCHVGAPGRTQRGPSLEGVYGHQVALADGRAIVADDNYIRESILTPTAKVVAGYDPVMPTFQGQVSEEQLSQLVAYVRSLGGTGSSPAGGTGGSNAGATNGANSANGATNAAGGQTDANTPQTAGPGSAQQK